MNGLTIGKIAKGAEVKIDTVRYYERSGLIPIPGRSDSGYRLYGSDTVDRILFVKQAQELGFTLREIKELLSLKMDPACTCGSIKKRTVAKIEDIQGKIKVLNKMKKSLGKLADACDGNDFLSVSECPILDAIGNRHAKN